MSVQKLLQINIAVLAGLGALLLGMGQQSTLLPVVAGLAAVTSIVFTDTLRWFHLNRNVANLAALLAVALALKDFSRYDSETQLVSIANLLIYLQIVLLHQEKTDRIYWQLALLSLLQVVVAAALNLGFEFGLLLVAYMVVAITALVLIFLHRETHRFQGALAEPRPPAAGAFRSFPAARRWPLSAEPAAVSCHLAENPGDNVWRWGLVGHVLKTSFTMIAVSTFVFFALPRLRATTWQGTARPLGSTVGYSQRVTLGEEGDIAQNPELVMRVGYQDPATGRAYLLNDEPRWRGTALSVYALGDGSWSYYDDFSIPVKLRPPPADAAVIHQEVVLEPMYQGRRRRRSERQLFSLAPAYATSESPESLRYDPANLRLLQETTSSEERRTQITFQLAVGGVKDGWQTDLIPADTAELPAAELRQLLQFPDQRDPVTGREMFLRIKQEARTVLARTSTPTENIYAVAKALETHFHQPGEFRYSLHLGQVPRDISLDPVEDFVANHRTGHCEYFASALALMLRSQKIPARLVVGFKGGEYNSVGEYYLVRQLHAHAWVEVYLLPEQVPPHLRSPQLAGGAWLQLDPTPSSDEVQSALAQNGLWGTFGEWFDFTQLLWNEYILGLNSERQEKAIYQPLRESFADLWASIVTVDGWGEEFARLLGLGPLEGEVTTVWDRLRLGAAVFVVLLLAVWLFRTVWRLVVRLFARIALPDAASPHRRGREVEFYNRLERLLALRGLTRPPAQTQREFAGSAGGQLADSPRCQHVSSLPRRVVELFYRVRFGGHTLDNSEQLSVEHALAELDAALAGEPTGHREPAPPSV